MKILISLTLIGFFVFAQSLPFDNSPPNIDCGSNFFDCLKFFFYRFLRIIVSLAYILATIFIAWGGIEYMIYGADENKRKTATQRLIWGTIGFIIAISAHAFVILIERTAREGLVENIKENVQYSVGYVENDLEENVENLKRIQLSLPFIAYADVEEPIVPSWINCGSSILPSVLESTSISSGDIWKICILYYLERFTSFSYGIALALGVLFLVWAGILYITQPEKTKDIHGKLFYGVLGIVIAILSVTIVKIIDLFFVSLR